VFGFGISTQEHVRMAIAAGALGVICGSAIVGSAARGEDVTELIRSLKAATRERLAAAMN
jgi:tryptophan synthase alpha chain